MEWTFVSFSKTLIGKKWIMLLLTLYLNKNKSMVSWDKGLKLLFICFDLYFVR